MCEEYSGYTNYATWLVATTFFNPDQFDEDAKIEYGKAGNNFEFTRIITATKNLEEYIENNFIDCMEENYPQDHTNILYDIINYFIDLVNFWEIAKMYVEEVERNWTPEDEEEYSEEDYEE